MKYPELYLEGYYGKVFPYNQLNEEQLAKFLQWDSTNPTSRAVDGANYTWHFTPTSLGMVIKVSSGINGSELDLTDYDSW